VSMSEGYGPRLAKAVGAVCEGFAGLLLEVQGLQRLKVSMSEGYGPGFGKIHCCCCTVHSTSTFQCPCQCPRVMVQGLKRYTAVSQHLKLSMSVSMS